jgi:hypothetical protein
MPMLVPLAQMGHDPIRLVRSSPCISAMGMRVVAVLLHEGLEGTVRSTDGLGWPSQECYGPHRHSASGAFAARRLETWSPPGAEAA